MITLGFCRFLINLKLITWSISANLINLPDFRHLITPSIWTNLINNSLTWTNGSDQVVQMDGVINTRRALARTAT